MTREEAIKELAVHLVHWKRLKNEHIVPTDECENTINALRMAIEALSAERPHGEWINRENCQVDEDAYEVATCSNCKSEITIEYPHDNFCPNCGADMRGEK